MLKLWLWIVPFIILNFDVENVVSLINGILDMNSMLNRNVVVLTICAVNEMLILSGHKGEEEVKGDVDDSVNNRLLLFNFYRLRLRIKRRQLQQLRRPRYRC